MVTTSKSSSPKKKKPNFESEKRKINKKLAIAIAGSLGILSAYYLYNKKKNPKKMDDETIKKELKILQKVKNDIDEKYNTFKNTMLLNLSSTFKLPFSPIPVLKQKKYNDVTDRISKLQKELDKRIQNKKENIEEELAKLKSQVKNIEDKIKENQDKINDKLWQEGILVYNGVLSASDQTLKYIHQFKQNIQNLKDTSVTYFDKIRILEEELKKIN